MNVGHPITSFVLGSHTVGYSQCQPIGSSGSSGSSVTSKPPTRTPTPTPTSNPWSWSFTRPHRTWPGQPGRSSTSRVVVPSQPGRTTVRPTSTAPPTPTPTVAQLWEQCGGQYWGGPKICVQGLKCVVIDECRSKVQYCRFKADQFRSLLSVPENIISSEWHTMHERFAGKGSSSLGFELRGDKERRVRRCKERARGAIQDAVDISRCILAS